MSLRLSAYRSFARAVFAFLPIRNSQEELLGNESGGVRTQAKAGLVWFHAASAGELESLAPVAFAWAASGRQVALSVFSRSGLPQMHRLAERIRKQTGMAPIQGISPAEGEWSEAFSKFRPEAFVTVKYEAWPDLWASLTEKKIPLYVIGAKERSSFRWIKRVLSGLGSELPSLHLLTVRPAEIEPLKRLFPAAGVDCAGEPRWDQVASRASQGSPRANELLKAFSEFPRPWGILAQAWGTDLAVWKSVLSSISGTLWVVPHRLEKRENEELIRELANAGFSVIPTGSESFDGALPGQGPRRAVFVNEMGVLAELYSAMDWCYVGGGFGDGVHSTIEPAIHGLPLSVGPHGVPKFPEIQQLRDSGQLSVVLDAAEASAWLKTAMRVDSKEKERWKAESQQRLGASDRIVSILRAGLGAGLSAPESHANL